MNTGGEAAANDRLVSDVRSMRELLHQLRFPFEAAGAQAARTDSAAIVRQLDDHVLPRLQNLDAPALVVVGGSTGSGKSLLVSSIVGSVVSASGVIRPTTRSPVLVHHHDDAAWFDAQRVLPGLGRVRDHRLDTDGSAEDPRRELRLVASDSLPSGIALLDAPDIDSVDAVNRELAAQLLAAADVWVFVTTAARYADAVPWGFLESARERGAPLVLVLNRVPDGAGEEVTTDLVRMLTRHGLGDTPVFTIIEQPLQADHLLGDAAAPVRDWLTDLGADNERRVETIRRSLRGVFVDLTRRSEGIATAADAQQVLGNSLASVAEDRYAHAVEAVRAEIADGAIIRGEVLARWEEFIGTGELLRQLRTGIGRIRSRIAGAVTGRPVTREQLNVAVENVLERLIVTQGDAAAAETLTTWKAMPVGDSLAARASADLGRASSDLTVRTAATLREWQSNLVETVRDKGAGRRTTARVMSLGVNGVSAVLMMLVFSHTGGLTGGEVAIAGGASAVGHALLEALLGDENLRRLATEARQDLIKRVTDLYDEERRRFTDTLDSAGAVTGAGDELRQLSSSIAKASQ
jgi:energy-coupling factor transporter ATP-binding protein EcfA2